MADGLWIGCQRQVHSKCERILSHGPAGVGANFLSQLRTELLDRAVWP